VRLPAAGTPRDIYVTSGAVYMLLPDPTSDADGIWALVRAAPF